MHNQRLLNLISLCKKAGKLAAGEENCEKAIQKGLAKIVFLATDASDNTKKKFNNKAAYYDVPIYTLFTKEVLGNSIGMQGRATIVITDEGFAKKIMELVTCNS